MVDEPVGFPRRNEAHRLAVVADRDENGFALRVAREIGAVPDHLRQPRCLGPTIPVDGGEHLSISFHERPDYEHEICAVADMRRRLKFMHGAGGTSARPGATPIPGAAEA